jgi:hypothetical protein
MGLCACKVCNCVTIGFLFRDIFFNHGEWITCGDHRHFDSPSDSGSNLAGCDYNHYNSKSISNSHVIITLIIIPRVYPTVIITPRVYPIAYKSHISITYDNL